MRYTLCTPDGTRALTYPVINGPFDGIIEGEVFQPQLPGQILAQDRETNPDEAGVAFDRLCAALVKVLGQTETIFHLVTQLLADVARLGRVGLELFPDDREIGLVSRQPEWGRGRGESNKMLDN